MERCLGKLPHTAKLDSHTYIYLSHKVCKESSANFEEFYIGIYKLSFQKGVSGTDNYGFFLTKAVDWEVILHKRVHHVSTFAKAQCYSSGYFMAEHFLLTKLLVASTREECNGPLM